MHSLYIKAVSVYIDIDRYAREDTHYLLYIYDVMKIELLSLSTESDSSNACLVEVRC